MNTQASRHAALGILIALLAVVGLRASGAQEGPLLRGTVLWGPDDPAHGVQIRLVAGENELGTTFTNPDGKYGFFELDGLPDEVDLQVISGEDTLATRQVTGVEPGDKVETIVIEQAGGPTFGNSWIESTWSRIKVERGDQVAELEDQNGLEVFFAEYIPHYNRRSRHSGIGNKPPINGLADALTGITTGRSISRN